LQLLQAYRLKAFLKILILDSGGKSLRATEGYMDAKTLIAFGKAAMEKRKK
jgi:thioredoxin-related protein